MPIYQNGVEIKQLALPGPGNGMDEIESAYMWNGTGWDEVFRRYDPYDFYHNFDGLPTGELANLTSEFGKWTAVTAGSGNNRTYVEARDGMARASAHTTDGTFQPWIIHSTPCRGNDIEVEIRLASASWNTYSSGILIGMNAQANTGLAVQLNSNASLRTLVRIQNGEFTDTGVTIGGSGQANSLWRVQRRVSADGISTYRIFENNVQVGEWIDAQRLVPNNENHRHGGMMFTFRRALFTSYASAAFTEFRVRDVD